MNSIAEREKNDLKATILRSMAEGVCLVRASDGAIVYTNPKFEAMFGYNSGELVGKTVSCLNSGSISERTQIMRDLMRIILEKGHHTYDIQNIRKDGTRLWCRATTSTFEHETHGLVFVAVHEDISVRKETEQRLEESERRFRALFDSAYDSIVVVNTTATIQMVNPSTEALFGYRSEELIGQPVEILVPERYREKHVQHHLNYGGVPHSRAMGQGLELYGRRKDGSEFPVDVSLSPFKVNGKLHFTAVVRDMTAQKQLEIELRRLNRQANDAVRAREEVLAVVSHDLKNPLSVILLSAQLVGATVPALDVKSRALLEKASRSIAGSVKIMQDLISGILDLAKIQGGTFSIDPKEESLSTILESIVETLKPLAQAKSIQISLRFDRDLPRTSCDRARIGQVVSNLLGNAIKFTPRKGLISVSARHQGTNLLVEVSDTGPGISENHLPHLFERYWQARETAGLGTGLGLAIAKGILDAHKGKIWAESTVGRGSTFHFTLPVVSAIQGALAG